MPIEAPVASRHQTYTAENACAAAVFAHDVGLRRRMAAALAPHGFRVVEGRTLDDPESERWDALVIASDLDGAPDLLGAVRRRIGERVAVVLVGPDQSNPRLLRSEEHTS